MSTQSFTSAPLRTCPEVGRSSYARGSTAVVLSSCVILYFRPVLTVGSRWPNAPPNTPAAGSGAHGVGPQDDVLPARALRLGS